LVNQYYLSLLQEGSDSWNQWRGQSPEIHPDLTGARLSGIDLRGVNLSETNLTQALLNGASLQGALFWRATLRESDLHGADLRQAHFYQADLRQANLSGSNLDQTNFREALLNGTNLANIDLSSVKGLETVRHEGRSYLDIHTLYRSQGQIPEEFLRGIGAPEHFILYTNTMLQAPVQYLSCFISSSQRDSAFVSRLYADLQQQGIRCWSVFHDLNNEYDDIKEIKETIQMHDTWLLVLSEYTLISEWVKQEIYLTMNMEQQQKRTILFPLCLNQDFLDLTPSSIISLLQNRQTHNFIGWQDDTTYQQAFTALLQDLKKAG
jgi:uncharacterized protein YjbI with pentapeptide repeats